MGFFKDLFGPRQPCDLCQLGQASWPSDRSGSADWKLWGGGLRANLLICRTCYGTTNTLGLKHKNPMLALVTLARMGQAYRPPAHAYLQHSEWRKIWMHMLDNAGAAPTDEFAALAMITELEDQLFNPDPLREGL